MADDAGAGTTDSSGGEDDPCGVNPTDRLGLRVSSSTCPRPPRSSDSLLASIDLRAKVKRQETDETKLGRSHLHHPPHVTLRDPVPSGDPACLWSS